MSPVYNLLPLLLFHSASSLPFIDRSWINKAKHTPHRISDFVTGLLDDVNVDISFSTNTNTDPLLDQQPDSDSDNKHIHHSTSYSFSIFTNNVRPQLSITESTPLYLVVQSPTESPSDTPQTTFQLLPSDKINENTYRFTLRSDKGPTTMAPSPWSDRKMYLCHNPSCSNGEGIEMESAFSDFIDDDPLRNYMRLVPKNTLNVDYGMDKMDKIDDFGDDITSKLQSPDSGPNQIGFGEGLSSMIQRLVDGFNGYKHDWYRRYRRYRGEIDADPMERMSGWSAWTVFETTSSDENLWFGVDDVMMDEHGESMPTTTAVTWSSTTKRIDRDQGEAVNEREVEHERNAKAMMEPRSLEIKDEGLNRELADESSTQSHGENNLLLTQMTLIIVFIVVSGTMYVLWKYWLERRQRNRDLDYYRLPTDL